MISTEKLRALRQNARILSNTHQRPFRAEWDDKDDVCRVFDASGRLLATTPDRFLGAFIADLSGEPDVLDDAIAYRESREGT